MNAPAPSGAMPGHRFGIFGRAPKLALTAFVFLAAAFVLGVALAGAVAPSVTVEPATQIGVTSALAKGTVNPEGKETNCHFDYIADAQFGQNPSEPFEGASQGPCAGNPLNGNAALSVEAALGGLKPGTEYHLRLAAENSEGESSSETAPTFETDSATVPSAAVTGSSGVSYTWAKLEGTIDPEGGNSNPIEGTLPIGWQLQYAPASEAEPRNWQSANLTSTNPIEGAAAASSTPIAIEALAVGLQPDSEYAFRAVAFYAGGLEAVSPAQNTFNTLSVAKPSPTVDPVTTFTDSSAHLVGHVNPNAPEPEGSTSPAEQAAFETSWHFECVAPGPPCGSLSGTVVPAGNTAKTVEADATGLEPNKAYYVKLVATNLGGPEGATTTAAPSFVTTAVVPTVRALAAAPVQSEAAGLNGEVNPHNSPTKYWFEWGTQNCETSSCTALPASKDADAGAGPSFAFATQHLTGLTPGTTYHYRLVAENSAGTVPGEDRELTTASSDDEAECTNEARRVEQHSTELPECRAYERVSPSEKNGGDITADSSRVQVTADGSAAIYSSLTGFGDVRGTGVNVDYRSQRTGLAGTSGWTTHALVPQQGPTSGSGVTFNLAPRYEGEFTPDLTKGIYERFEARPEDVNVRNVANLYLRDDLQSPGAGNYQLLTAASSPLPPSLSRPWLAGASTDLSHIIFETKSNLTAGTVGSQYKLFEWDEGVVRLVGILPDGSTARSGAATASNAGAGAHQPYRTKHTISSDGSRVFFTAGSGLEGDIYARINGEVSVQLNRSERATPDSPAPARYWTASTDGSRVFFSTTEGLVDGDDNQEPDLYLWKQGDHNESQQITVDASGGTFTLSYGGVSTAPIAATATAIELQAALTAIRGPLPDELPILPAGDVSVSGGPGAPGGADPYLVTFQGDLAGVAVPKLEADASNLIGGTGEVSISVTEPVSNLSQLSRVSPNSQVPPRFTNVFGASADGHYVYFSAKERLVPDADGPINTGGGGIYVWHDGDVRYIGGIDNSVDVELNGIGLTWGSVQSAVASRVSPDGRYLMFMASDDAYLAGRGGFGGVDNGHCDNPGNSGGCRELYIFDSSAGTLRCASCPPALVPATADAQVAVRKQSGGSSMTYHLPHLLSDDGRFVFFSTAEALVPGDTNGKIDVYEYDSLTERQSLLSSGTDSRDSYLVEASPSGHDVFFTTGESLVGWDSDKNYDLYDARIDGGVPEPPPAVGPCQGDSCLPPYPSAKNVAATGSSSVTGKGNLTPKRPCGRQRKPVKSHGKVRCVKKQSKHRDGKPARTANNNRRAGR